MNATEARQIADKLNEGLRISQLEYIEKGIEKASRLGKYEFVYVKTLEKGVREELNKRGFSVGKEEFERDGESFVKISW